MNAIIKSLKRQLANLQTGDRHFTITRYMHKDLSFGNQFEILTNIHPQKNLTFTLIDQTKNTIILAYNEYRTVRLIDINRSYTEIITHYKAFNKKEFMRQLEAL